MRLSSSRDSPTPQKNPSEACLLDGNVLCLYFIEPGRFEERRLETTGKCDWRQPCVTRPHCWSVLLGTFSICQILKSSWIFIWLKVWGAPTSRNHVNSFFLLLLFLQNRCQRSGWLKGLKAEGQKYLGWLLKGAEILRSFFEVRFQPVYILLHVFDLKSSLLISAISFMYARQVLLWTHMLIGSPAEAWTWRGTSIGYALQASFSF